MLGDFPKYCRFYFILKAPLIYKVKLFPFIQVHHLIAVIPVLYNLDINLVVSQLVTQQLSTVRECSPFHNVDTQLLS